jgi:hypothetical protein
MDPDFLGIGLQPLALDQHSTVGALLARHPQPLSGYTFTSLCCWHPVFDYHVGIQDDTLLISCCPDCAHGRQLLQPVGAFPETLQGTILGRARELAHPLRIIFASAEFLARHPAFVAEFEVQESRDNANYVYRAQALAELPGRSHAKKRNLIAQASRLYEWTVEPLGPHHRDECLAVADDIAAKRTVEAGVTLQQETTALARALDLLGPLDLQGLLLRVAGAAAAFSIIEPLNATTAVVMFERAIRSHKGIYQVINQETARMLVAAGFELVNREEDLGDPGLRQAKLSYHPDRLEMAYTLTLRR